MKTVITCWLKKIQNFDKLDQQVHIDNMLEYLSKIGQKQFMVQNKVFFDENLAYFQNNLQEQFKKVDISNPDNIIYAKFLQQFGYAIKYQINVSFENLSIRELKQFSKIFFYKKDQFVNLEFKKQIERALIHNRVMKNLTYVLDYSDLDSFTDTAEYDLILNGHYKLDMSRYNKYIIKLLYISYIEIVRLNLQHPDLLTTVFLNKVIGFTFDQFVNLQTIIINDMELEETNFCQCIENMKMLKNIEIKYCIGASDIFFHIKSPIQYISIYNCQLQGDIFIGDGYRSLKFLRIHSVGTGKMIITAQLMKLEIFISKLPLQIENTNYIRNVQYIELLSEKQSCIEIRKLKFLKYFKAGILTPMIFNVKKNNIVQINEVRFDFTRHTIFGRDFMYHIPLQNYCDYYLLIQTLIQELQNSQKLYLQNQQFNVMRMLFDRTIYKYCQDIYKSDII